jgi:hypothetical protein
MIEKPDVIQQVFDRVQADTRNEGFSERLVLRLARRRKIRIAVLVAAALSGFVLFASQLIGIESLTVRVMDVAFLFSTGALLKLPVISQWYLIVVVGVVVWVLSTTTLTLINAVRA